MKFIRVISTVLWAAFTLWMFVYSMPISALFSTLFLWHLQPFWPTRTRTMWLLLLLSPLVVWNVGLVEYGRKTIDLHCRVLGYANMKPAGFCWVAPHAHNVGRTHTEGQLLSSREQIGVHGFNVLLATGGLLAGLPEVAWETLYMSFAPDPSPMGMDQQTKRQRLAQCKGGGNGTTTHPEAVSTGSGSFLLDSSTIRKIVAPRVAAAKRVQPGKTRQFQSKKVNFKGQGQTNNEYYGSLMRRDNLRAPITLVVPDGTLHLSATNEGSAPRFDIAWSGTISYPPKGQFMFTIPTVWSLPPIAKLTNMSRPFPVIVSEAMFCGMTMDGAMNPYVQRWEVSADVSDERFSATGKTQSAHGWIEHLLGLVM